MERLGFWLVEPAYCCVKDIHDARSRCALAGTSITGYKAGTCGEAAGYADRACALCMVQQHLGGSLPY